MSADPRLPALSVVATPSRIQAWREVNELPDRENQTYCSKLRQIEPGHVDGDREGGAAQQTETG